MPTRSRTHQLEDISIQQFEGLLPDAWVSRRKDKDYGVDMEVEVFDDEGQSTGLMFLVQLKATDDADKARAVSMKVDRLDYLASLDAPSMVVRYCEPSRSFHWIWLTNIFARIPPPDTETITIKFETNDLWSVVTPKAILRTLRIFRTMRTGSRRMPVGLEVLSEGAEPDAAFAINYAVGRVLDVSTHFVRSDDPMGCLPIRVNLQGDTLCVEIDTIVSIRVILRSADREEVFTQLIYVIAYMVGRAGFDDQLYELAEVIRRDGLISQSRSLASDIASAVVVKSDLAAAISRLNTLHDRQDEAYARYVMALLDLSISPDKKAAGIDLFYRDAIKAHEGQSKQAQASIHYSYGNSLRVAFDLPSALKQFNLARTKHPAYLDKPYFLAETGATLYFLRRYRLSSKFYAAAYTIDPSPKTAICAGDAFLFSGDPNQAQKFYQISSKSEDQFEAAEGGLKAFLASWVKEFCTNNAKVTTDHLSRAEFWSDLMQYGMDEDRYDQARNAALLLSFCLEDDPAAWTDAIQTAVRDGNAELLVGTLTCAIERCGYAAYSQFRDLLVLQDFPQESVRLFDELVRELHDRRPSVVPKRPTIRLLDPPALDRAVHTSSSPPLTDIPNRK